MKANIEMRMGSPMLFSKLSKAHVRLGLVLSLSALGSVDALEGGRGDGTWISKQCYTNKAEGMGISFPGDSTRGSRPLSSPGARLRV